MPSDRIVRVALRIIKYFYNEETLLERARVPRGIFNERSVLTLSQVSFPRLKKKEEEEEERQSTSNQFELFVYILQLKESGEKAKEEKKKVEKRGKNCK